MRRTRRSLLQKNQMAEIPKKWDGESDVIIVGSGATGLSAAVSAVDMGASVIVLEQGEEVGGCSIISSGIIDLQGGTRIQKLNNIEDSPELMFKRLLSYENSATKKNDLKLLRVFCDANPVIFDWLEQHGVRFMGSITDSSPSGRNKSTHAYHRIWWNKEGPGMAAFKSPAGVSSGAGLIKPLEMYARAKGVQFLMKHKVRGIIREREMGKIIGVELLTDGKALNFRSKRAVVLGSGGWKGNIFMRKLFDSRITEDIEPSGTPFVNSDGSGIIAALKIGAILMSDRAVDRALFRRKFGTRHYSFPLNSKYGAPGIRIEKENTADVIFINKSGQRYINEQDIPSSGYSNFFDASLAQEDHVLWSIFDDTAAKNNKWQVTTPVTEKDYAYSASNLYELARLINVPEDTLVQTVKRYNAHVDNGFDPDFGKSKGFLNARIENAPFHALRITLYAHDTCGGLAVNHRAQVLDVEGKVITGLYAGGEAAGGIDIPGLPRCVILGRIAGEEATAEQP